MGNSPRPKTVDRDKPKIGGSRSSLQTDAPEAYVYITESGHRVTFPDPFDMEWDEGERFLEDVAGAQKSRDALAKWLDADDFQALKDEQLTLREGMVLVQKIMQHYEAFMGTPGEGQRSAS